MHEFTKPAPVYHGVCAHGQLYLTQMIPIIYERCRYFDRIAVHGNDQLFWQ